MNAELQTYLENHHSKYNTAKYLRHILIEWNEEVLRIVNDIYTKIEECDYNYTLADGTPKVREDLVECHEALLALNLEELIWDMVSLVVVKDKVTLQQLVGSVFNKFSSIEMPSRRLKAIELLLEGLDGSYMVEFDIHRGTEVMVYSCIDIGTEGKDTVSKQGVVLPSVVPLNHVRSNSDIGYTTFKKSVLMGGKHHDKEVCLSHINKCNSIAFTYDHRIHKYTTPTFCTEPKLKKNGQWETDNDIQERKEAWDHIYSELGDKLLALGNNEFYFAHRYDVRGRTYPEANHLNYQGDTDRKALINLAHKEFIAPEF